MQILIFDILLSCDELLQDATSEGDVEEDAGSLADEKVPLGFLEVKTRIKNALLAINADARAAVKIVMDSAAYMKLPAELRFEKVEAVTLQIQDSRLHTCPKSKPLKCLVEFMFVVEARTLPVILGKFAIKA